MKVERILSETDLLPQRIAVTSRKKKEQVLNEDAVSFEPSEERKKEQQDKHYLSYSLKQHHITPAQEADVSVKEDLDVVA